MLFPPNLLLRSCAMKENKGEQNKRKTCRKVYRTVLNTYSAQSLDQTVYNMHTWEGYKTKKRVKINANFTTICVKV